MSPPSRERRRRLLTGGYFALGLGMKTVALFVLLLLLRYAPRQEVAI
jgi:hypothetical protein